MFNCKKNIFLVFKHFRLLDSGYGVLPYKLESAILIIKFTFS